MNLRYIFLSTVDDIRQKMNGERYDLLRACGLLRHLFLDKNCMFVQLCKEFGYDIKIVFKANDLKNDPMVNKGTLLLWEKIAPVNAIYTRFYLHEFLSVVCLHYMGSQFTVKDIIGGCSHMLGGIHTRNPENERERLLCDWFGDSNVEFQQMNNLFSSQFDIIIKSDETAFQTVRDICEICLEALCPYEDRAKS